MEECHLLYSDPARSHQPCHHSSSRVWESHRKNSEQLSRSAALPILPPICRRISKTAPGNTRVNSSPQWRVSAFPDEAKTPTRSTRDSSLKRFCPTSRSKKDSPSLTQCGPDTRALQRQTRALGRLATAKASSCILLTLKHQTDNGTKKDITANLPSHGEVCLLKKE